MLEIKRYIIKEKDVQVVQWDGINTNEILDFLGDNLLGYARIDEILYLNIRPSVNPPSKPNYVYLKKNLFLTKDTNNTIMAITPQYLEDHYILNEEAQVTNNIMRPYVENCFSYGAVQWDGTNTEEIIKYMNNSGGDLWDYAVKETNRGGVPFTYYISEDGDLVITQKVREDRIYSLKIVPNGYLMQFASGAFTAYQPEFKEHFKELKGEWKVCK